MVNSPLTKPSTPPPQHRRSISAPLLNPPQISIEDLTQPLTDPEDPLNSPSGHSSDPKRRYDNPNDGNGSPYERRRSSNWHRNKKSPGVGWKKRWDESHYPWHNGRVLIVDCYSRDHSDDGRRKTQAYEFERVEELRDFYNSGPGMRDDHHALRIVHVQNAVWARDLLLKKFNIVASGDGADDVIGTGFGRWAKYDKPQYRAGKPVLNARSFRASRDPWRGISRTGFGVDYLKSYKPGVFTQEAEDARSGFKLMELNHWEEERGTSHGYNVYTQRLSVYIQRNEGPINMSPTDAEVRNPYIDTAREWRNQNGETEKSGLADRRASLPVRKESEAHIYELLSSLDNGSTIIIFEASHTEHPRDTLIQAREEIEVRWRRLMFYLSRDDLGSDDRLGLECMDLVLKDIFKSLQISWDKLLSKCEEHINILEEKIYENPADESRAPELWTNSSLWLKLEKLMSLQRATISDVQQQMRELAESEEGTKEEWFKNTPQELGRVADLIEEELIKPTANLSDLMYKSVGIRDARHSLELGTSMWRLSWITFIFLPLTFMVGFFGMNVDVFQNDPKYPSIKWYFIASVPLMILVIILYMFIKSVISKRRDNPLQRGVYEQIYTQFSNVNPALWSRTGPKAYVTPKGWISKLKWKFVKMWFHPSATIARKTYSEIDKLGPWARIKRYLAQKWLGEIELAPGSGDPELGLSDIEEFSTLASLLRASTPIAMADADPRAALRMRGGSPPFSRTGASRRRNRSGSGASSGKQGRTGSPGSDMIVEESDGEGSGKGSPKLEVTVATRRKESDDESPSPASARDGPRRVLFNDGVSSGGFLSPTLNARRSEERAP